MNVKDILPDIVKVGMCEYGENLYRVFICKSDIFPGTGDYEDDEEIREDREVLCYCIWVENFTQKDELNVSWGYRLSLNEAVEYVEKSVGFQKWIDMYPIIL